MAVEGAETEGMTTQGTKAAHLRCLHRLVPPRRGGRCAALPPRTGLGSPESKRVRAEHSPRFRNDALINRSWCDEFLCCIDRSDAVCVGNMHVAHGILSHEQHGGCYPTSARRLLLNFSMHSIVALGSAWERTPHTTAAFGTVPATGPCLRKGGRL